MKNLGDISISTLMTHFQPQQKILSSLKKKKSLLGTAVWDVTWNHGFTRSGTIFSVDPGPQELYPLTIQTHESRALCRYC